MDHETLQALISVYRVRTSTDLLSIILDEAESVQSQSSVLDLLRALPAEALTGEGFAPVRRKACRFCLNAEDFDLAERIAKASDLPDDKALRARALHGLGREQEAVALYRQAVLEDPAIRNRDMERLLGIRPGTSLTAQPAKIISLTTYSSRKENRSELDRRDAQAEAFLDELDDAVTFADVAGLEEIKNAIRRRIVLPYLKPSLFEKFRQKPGGNLLLYGPPGCGKTLIARATAGESDARFLSVNPEDVLDKYAGEAEKRLRVFFDEARSDTPAILFFDDFHLLAGSRRAKYGGAAPALVAALLSELDGAQRNNRGVLVLAATNAPWALDPAFFRPGRFQSVNFVPPPEPAARKRILSVALHGVPGADRLAIDRVVRKAAGMSGADLRALAEWACDKALAKMLSGGAEQVLTNGLIEEGLKLLVPSASDWLRSARTKLRAMDADGAVSRVFAPLYRA